MAENAGGKQPRRGPGRRFRAGQSGNPAGKPPGTRHRATRAAEMLLEGEAEALTRKAIERALAGDTTALRLCLDRVLPPRKGRPVVIDLPPVQSPADTSAAVGAVVRAMASGAITPDEALAAVAVLEAQRRAIGARENGGHVNIVVTGGLPDPVPLDDAPPENSSRPVPPSA